MTTRLKTDKPTTKGTEYAVYECLTCGKESIEDCATPKAIRYCQTCKIITAKKFLRISSPEDIDIKSVTAENKGTP